MMQELLHLVQEFLHTALQLLHIVLELLLEDVEAPARERMSSCMKA